MTTDHPDDDRPASSRTVDDLARQAGAAFRRSADDGAIERVVAAGRRRQRRQIAAVAAVGVLAIGGVLLSTVGHDGGDSVTADTTPPAQTAETAPGTSVVATTTTTAISSSTSPSTLVTVSRDFAPTVPIESIQQAGIESVADVDKPNQVVTDGRSVWVSHDLGPISRFDATTGELLGTIAITNDLNAEPPILAFGSLWVTNDLENRLYRIDASSESIQAAIDIPGDIVGGSVDAHHVNPMNVTASEDYVWVLSLLPDGSSVAVEVDPSGSTVTRTIPAPQFAAFIGYGDGSLWSSGGSFVSQFSPLDGEVQSSQHFSVLGFGLYFGEGNIWTWLGYVDSSASLVKIDPGESQVIGNTNFRLASYDDWRANVAFGGGYVWANSAQAVLVKIDPKTMTVVARYDKSVFGGSVAATDTDVWFTDYDANRLYRLRLT